MGASPTDRFLTRRVAHMAGEQEHLWSHPGGRVPVVQELAPAQLSGRLPVGILPGHSGFPLCPAMRWTCQAGSSR